MDAIVDEALDHPDDLRSDRRWPEYAVRVHQELGWISMLSFRLRPELAGVELVAGLNLYADVPLVFDETATHTGLLLATHGGMAVGAEINRDRAEHLGRALATNRDIGVAIGVLMARHQLTRQQAFDLLRVASQDRNRKLHTIAVEVADTGTLNL